MEQKMKTNHHTYCKKERCVWRTHTGDNKEYCFFSQCPYGESVTYSSLSIVTEKPKKKKKSKRYFLNSIGCRHLTFGGYCYSLKSPHYKCPFNSYDKDQCEYFDSLYRHTE